MRCACGWVLPVGPPGQTGTFLSAPIGVAGPQRTDTRQSGMLLPNSCSAHTTSRWTGVVSAAASQAAGPGVQGPTQLSAASSICRCTARRRALGLGQDKGFSTVLHHSSCTGHGTAHGPRVLAAAAAAAPTSGTSPLTPSPAAPTAPDPPTPEASEPLDVTESGQGGSGSSVDSSSAQGLQIGVVAVAKPLPLPLETQPQARTSGLRRSWNTGSRAEWFAATIGSDLWDAPQDLDAEWDTGSAGGAQGAQGGHRSRGSGGREARQGRGKGWGRDAERDRWAGADAGVSRGVLGLQGASSSSSGGGGASKTAAAGGGAGASSLDPLAGAAGQRLVDGVVEGQGEVDVGAQGEQLPAGSGAADTAAAAVADVGPASLIEHEAAGSGETAGRGPGTAAAAAGSGTGGSDGAGADDGAFNAAAADAEALLEAYVDPDMEWARGRMDPERIRALLYIRHLVLSQLRSSADARELVSAVDWTVPLMDLAGVAEALRMVRVAANSVEHPRNAQLMRRPRFQRCFYHVGQRLLGLLHVYGSDIMGWGYVMTAVGGMSAVGMRDPALLAALHDRALALMLEQHHARQRWERHRALQRQQALESLQQDLQQQEQQQQQQQALQAPTLHDQQTRQEEPTQQRDQDQAEQPQERQPQEQEQRRRYPRRQQQGAAGAGAGGDRSASYDGAPDHVQALSVRDLASRLLLPLARLGQPLDPAFFTVLEELLLPQHWDLRDAGEDNRMRTTGSNSGGSEQGEKEVIASGEQGVEGVAARRQGPWAQPLWLLRDVLELHVVAGRAPSVGVLAAVRDACEEAAEELRRGLAGQAVGEGSAQGWGEKHGQQGWAHASDRGRGRGGDRDRGRDEGRGSGRGTSRAHLRGPGQRSGETDGGQQQAQQQHPPERRLTAVAGSLASMLYLLGRVADQERPTTAAPTTSPASAQPSASLPAPSGIHTVAAAPSGEGFGVDALGGAAGATDAAVDPQAHTGVQAQGQVQEQVAPDFSWTHPLLEAMHPWLHTLTPLQLSGVGITAARLGAARRLFHVQLPGPQNAQGQGQENTQSPQGHDGSDGRSVTQPEQRSGEQGGQEAAGPAAAAGAAAAPAPSQAGPNMSAPGRLAPPPPPQRTSRPVQTLALNPPAKLPMPPPPPPSPSPPPPLQRHSSFAEAQLPPPPRQQQQQQQRQQPHVSFVSSPEDAPFLHAYCEAVFNTFVASQATHTSVSIGNVCDVVRGLAAVQLPYVPHKFSALPARLMFLATAIVSYELTQQKGFAPPYVVQVLTDTASIVRSAGSGVTVPAGVVGRFLAATEPLLPACSAASLAGLADALTVFTWVNPPAGWAEKYYEALAVRLCLGSGPASSDGAPGGAEPLVEGIGVGGSDLAPPHGRSEQPAEGAGGSEIGPPQRQSEQPVEGDIGPPQGQAGQPVGGGDAGGGDATSEHLGQPHGHAGQLVEGTDGGDLGPPQGHSEQPAKGTGVVGSDAGSEQLGPPQEQAGQLEPVGGKDDGGAGSEDTGKAEGGGLVETVADGDQVVVEGAGGGGVQAQGPPTLRRYQSNRMPQQPEQLSLVELLRLLRGLERLSGLGAPPPADLVAALQEGLAAHLAAARVPVAVLVEGVAARASAPVAGGRPDGMLGEEEVARLLQLAGVVGRERVGREAGSGSAAARDRPMVAAAAVWLAEALARGSEDTSGVTATSSQQQQQSAGAAGDVAFAPREVVLAALERAHTLLLESQTAALTASSSSLQGDAVPARREPPTAASLLAQARVLRAALGRPVGPSWWAAASSLLVATCSAQLQGVVEAAALGKERTARGLLEGMTAAGVAELAAAVRGEDNQRAIVALAAANELLEFLTEAAAAGIPTAAGGTWTLGMVEGGDGDDGDGGGAATVAAVGGPAVGPAYAALPAAWWRAASFAARKCILGSRRPWARRESTAQTNGRTAQGRGKEGAYAEGTVSADGSSSSSGSSNRPPDSVLLQYGEVAEQTTRYAQHLGRWLEAQREAVAAGPGAEAAAGAGTAAAAAAYAAGVAVAKAQAAAARVGSHGVDVAGLAGVSHRAGAAARVELMPVGMEASGGVDSKGAEVVQGAGGLGLGLGVSGDDAAKVMDGSDSLDGGRSVLAHSGSPLQHVEQDQRMQQGDEHRAIQPAQTNSAGTTGAAAVASNNAVHRASPEEEDGAVQTKGSTAAGSSSTIDGEAGGEGNAYDALKKTHLSFLLDMCSLQLSAMRAEARGRWQPGGGGGAAQGAGQDAALTAAQGVRLAELLARTRFRPVHFRGLEDWPAAYMAQMEGPLRQGQLCAEDCCTLLRAVATQRWQPPVELMDGLLGQVQAQGGLARLRRSYGPQSLVQLLSWLSYARYLPSDPWMEDVCQQLLPAAHNTAGQAQTHSRLSADGGLGGGAQGSLQSASAQPCDLGLQELASLGSSLADMGYVPPAGWLRGALEAAGGVASAASAAAGGSHSAAVSHGQLAAPASQEVTGSSSSSSSSSGRMGAEAGDAALAVSVAVAAAAAAGRPVPEALALLLWRWGTLVARTAAAVGEGDANRNGDSSSSINGVTHGSEALGAAAARFAATMARATCPHLGAMPALHLVRCTEGMAELRQVVLAAAARRRVQQNAGLGAGARVGKGMGQDGQGGARGAGQKQQAGAAAAAVLEGKELEGAVEAELEMDEARLLAEAGVGRGEATAEAAEATAEGAKATAEAVGQGQAAEEAEAANVEGMGQATEAECQGKTVEQVGSASVEATGPPRGSPSSPGDGLHGATHHPLDVSWWWCDVEQASARSLLSHSPVRDHSPEPQGGGRQHQAPQGSREGCSHSGSGSGPSPYALSRVLRCMAACGHAPSPAWLQRYCQHTQPLLPSYKPLDTATTLWAFARLGLSLHAHSARQPYTSSPVAIRQPGGQGKQAHVPFLRAQHRRAPPALGPWLESAVGLLGQQVQQLSSADIQNVAWALGSMYYMPPAGWLQRLEDGTAGRLERLQWPALLYVLWAYGKFGHAPSGAYMERVLEVLRPGLLGRNVHPQHGAPPSPPPLDQQPPHQQPNQPAANPVPASSSSGRLDGHSLAVLLHSLSLLEYVPSEAWLQDYLRAVLLALPRMDTVGVTIVMRALATLQVYPTSSWLDRIIARAHVLLPRFAAASPGPAHAMHPAPPPPSTLHHDRAPLPNQAPGSQGQDPHPASTTHPGPVPGPQAHQARQQQQLEALLSALVDMAPATSPSDAVLRPFLHACLAAWPDNRKVAAFYRLLAATPGQEQGQEQGVEALGSRPERRPEAPKPEARARGSARRNSQERGPGPEVRVPGSEERGQGPEAGEPANGPRGRRLGHEARGVPAREGRRQERGPGHDGNGHRGQQELAGEREQGGSDAEREHGHGRVGEEVRAHCVGQGGGEQARSGEQGDGDGLGPYVEEEDAGVRAAGRRGRPPRRKERQGGVREQGQGQHRAGLGVGGGAGGPSRA